MADTRQNDNSSFNQKFEIRIHNGAPTFFLDGKPFTSCAYMSYFDEFATYKDFADAGYKLYSFPTYFASRAINVYVKGMKPMRSRGLFDKKNEPDFGVFDEDVKRILDACPDAYIFPRVDTLMPLWWEDENPDELNVLVNGENCRECIASEKYIKTAKSMFKKLINHVKNSDYSEHIIGYQIAGGGTEEWFVYGYPNGGLGKAYEREFKKFMAEKYPEEDYIIPDYEAMKNEFLNRDEDSSLVRYLEFLSYSTSEAILDIAKTVKEESGKMVGTFYGYYFALNDARTGLYALDRILKSPYIDFCCSMFVYLNNRLPGTLLYYLIARESVRINGKMLMAECDIRTNLTCHMNERRPDMCPDGGYFSLPVWFGPPTTIESKWVLRRTFAQCIEMSLGFWWFDMWGGWYASDELMNDMKLFKKYYERALNDKNRDSISEVALIIDPNAMFHRSFTGEKNDFSPNKMMEELSKISAPYDVIQVTDLKKISKKYKLIIFSNCITNTKEIQEFIKINNANFLISYVEDIPKYKGKEVKEVIFADGEKISISKHSSYKFSPRGENVMAFYEDNTPAITYDGKIIRTGFPELPVKLLKEACKVAGVHIYTDTQDGIYTNENHLAIHAVSQGEKIIRLKEKRKVSKMFEETDAVFTDKIKIAMEYGETVMFRLD